MKKLCVYLLAIALVLSLCACGQTESVPDSSLADSASSSISAEEEAPNLEDVMNTQVPDEEVLPSDSDENVDSSSPDSLLTPVDKDGTIFENENDTWIQNQDGEVIVSYANGDFDEIVAYGDGYYVLCRDASSFDTASYEVGIINVDGSWLIDYYAPTDSYRYSVRPDSFQNSDSNSTHVTDDPSGGWALMEYCGCGVFCYGLSDVYPSYRNYGTYRFISCTTQTEFFVENVGYPFEYGALIPQRDGDFSEDRPYITITCKDTTIVLGLSGIIGEISGTIDAIAPYADGGIVYYEEKWGNSELCFFDCTTGQSSLICRDSDRIDKNQVSSYQFENGQLDITLTGSDGQTYYATVDKQGNYIEEPHQK